MDISLPRAKQVSESIELGILLALSGGFMDAYSYIGRGEVFANAQTGNMLLFGVSLSEGNWELALTYLFPVASFSLGIMLADLFHTHAPEIFHWRQVAIFLEALILLFVAFIPFNHNLFANSLTSLACGIQVEAFRKIHGHGIATTMCIGNLRSAMQNVDDFLETHKQSSIANALLYLLIITCFIGGAVIGNLMLKQFGQYAIICCSLVLFICFLIMFIDREHADDEKLPQEL